METARGAGTVRNGEDRALPAGAGHGARHGAAAEGAIRALVRVIEVRDPYTAEHQRRVAAVCSAVARVMGLPGELAEGLRTAAIVHDVGKLCVPRDILRKPAPLSPAEFDIIRAHPQLGYDILEAIDFPWPVAQIVLQHHERLDGSGYPRGLSGDCLLLEAKILCIADVVETIASDRPYRPALGLSKAREEIEGRRDSLYEGAIVDACLTVLSAGEFSFARG